MPQISIFRLIKVEMVVIKSLRICVSTFLISLIVLVKPTNAVTYKTVADLVLIEKIDLTDLYNQSIILQRCAGLYGALARILPNEDSLKREETFNSSMVMLALATAQMAQKRELPLDDPSISDQVEKAFTIYTEIYFRDMEHTQILTGSIFNELLKNEFSICKRFLNNKNDEKDSDKPDEKELDYVTSYLQLKKITANLKTPNLKLGLGIALSTQYDETVVYNWEKNIEQIISVIKATVSEFTYEQVSGKANRDKLALEIMNAINLEQEIAYGFGGVDGVHFTNFEFE